MEPAERVAGFREGTLILETAADRCLRVRARFADTDEQRSQGLMFIEQMDEFEGMYFRYSPPTVINMWMKNTYIPLDMVFIRADGRIARIAFNESINPVCCISRSVVTARFHPFRRACLNTITRNRSTGIRRMDHSATVALCTCSVNAQCPIPYSRRLTRPTRTFRVLDVSDRIRPWQHWYR